MTKKSRRSAALFAALIAAAWIAADRTIFSPSETPYSRGEAAAVAHGCLSCHGSQDESTVSNRSLVSGLKDEHVPPLIGCELQPGDFSSWVLRGLPSGVDASNASAERRSALQMPAFSPWIDEAGAGDLLAWARIAGHATRVAKVQPNDRIAAGDALALKHGCYQCHGMLGQGGVANPGSLTGEVPPLTGNEFAHLTNSGDPAVIEEWIRTGRSESFLAGNPFAPAGRWFMDRQVIQMPPYEDLISDEDVQILVEFCAYLGSVGPMSAEAYGRHVSAARTDGTPNNPDTKPVSDSSGASQELPREVAEILSSRCIRCHGPKKQKSDYRMDTRADAMAQGEIAEFLEVKTIEPGDPSRSLLIQFISAAEEDPENEIFPMPPDEEDRLTKEQIRLVKEWVSAGAPWGESQELQSTYKD